VTAAGTAAVVSTASAASAATRGHVTGEHIDAVEHECCRPSAERRVGYDRVQWRTEPDAVEASCRGWRAAEETLQARLEPLRYRVEPLGCGGAGQ
jgi:hypothetical protein